MSDKRGLSLEVMWETLKGVIVEGINQGVSRYTVGYKSQNPKEKMHRSWRVSKNIEDGDKEGGCPGFGEQGGGRGPIS